MVNPATVDTLAWTRSAIEVELRYPALAFVDRDHLMGAGRKAVGLQGRIALTIQKRRAQVRYPRNESSPPRRAKWSDPA